MDFSSSSHAIYLCLCVCAVYVINTYSTFLRKIEVKSITLTKLFPEPQSQ